MSRSARWGVRLAIAAVMTSALACTRGAGQEALQRDLQTRLDRELKAGLFDVVALRREGSSPLPAVDSGRPRVVIYFNTTLRLKQDYAFGGWDQLAPQSLAYALGAREHGLVGLQQNNRSGDFVRAYGSAIYEQGPSGWAQVAAAPSETEAAPNIEGTAPPSLSKQLIDRLAAMVNVPAAAPQQDAIIAEELARAEENIERRVRRRQHTFTLATGAADGEYARFGAALVTAVNRLAPDVKLRQRTSEGSVDNARLLGRGEADYAIVQSDVAAAAAAGEDVFANAPITALRAVGSLFPEAIHIVVTARSPLRSIADLRGRRVSLGPASSGSRFDAVAVLSASGIKVDQLKHAGDESLEEALPRLKRGELDAIFVTGAAPIRSLQAFAVASGLRLLPIDGPTRERLVNDRPGLSGLTLPGNTYPKQQAAVATVAAAALLLTTADAPLSEVERVSNLVFTEMANEHAGGSDAVKLSGSTAQRGITVPLHPGAVHAVPTTGEAPRP